MSLDTLKKGDLHIHLWGAYYPEDLFAMARDYYREIDWNRFDFLQRYEEIYKEKLDPVEIFAEAEKTGSLEKIREIALFKDKDAGDFKRLDVKTFFAVAITGYFIDKGRPDVILDPILQRHEGEGLEYVEYRYSFGSSIFYEWHNLFHEHLQDHKGKLTPRAIVRLYDRGLESYNRLRDLLKEKPELTRTIVGVDFSGREIPPKLLHDFFKKLHADNDANPRQALDCVMHMGEVFYDKSMESAIRWCHEAAELGAKRLGHCLALGIDPALAVKRRPKAHTQEIVEERLDQITYDLDHRSELKEFGVYLDRDELLKEREELRLKEMKEVIYRAYDEERLKQIRRRQDFVLEKLKQHKTVIETCPTSNVRIGGIPSMSMHPFKKFFDSGVNLAICTDDPGVFDSPLSNEVELIAEEFQIDHHEMAERLGDPRRFRLGLGREVF